ncbi:MAG: iron-containing alcohol dehydrogenase, partial [Planctomycetaceae bacterium]|nr:iron-containing alcohol dehydrogenase [Planctomycetaceae bacterium]
LENAAEKELHRVLDFCANLGLPVCLEDIGLEDVSDDDLMKVAKMACDPEESIHSMPLKVNEDMVVAAIKAADILGRSFKAAVSESGCSCE